MRLRRRQTDRNRERERQRRNRERGRERARERDRERERERVFGSLPWILVAYDQVTKLCCQFHANHQEKTAIEHLHNVHQLSGMPFPFPSGRRVL